MSLDIDPDLTAALDRMTRTAGDLQTLLGIREGSFDRSVLLRMLDDRMAGAMNALRSEDDNELTSAICDAWRLLFASVGASILMDIIGPVPAAATA